MAYSGLSNHFKNHHIDGEHSANKKHNQVAKFKDVQYKSATKIERTPGKFAGQTKVITTKPSKFLETGWENHGNEGEAHFLVTGIKSGKSFTAHHVDCMLTRRKDGKFEDPKGNIWNYISDSDTADYSSGHDAWSAAESSLAADKTKQFHQETDWESEKCVQEIPLGDLNLNPEKSSMTTSDSGHDSCSAAEEDTKQCDEETGWELEECGQEIPLGNLNPSPNQKKKSKMAIIMQSCGNCGTVFNSNLRKCLSCRMVSYCNRYCQKSHWKEHKSNCHSKVIVIPVTEMKRTTPLDVNTIPKKIWIQIFRYLPNTEIFRGKLECYYCY